MYEAPPISDSAIALEINAHRYLNSFDVVVPSFDVVTTSFDVVITSFDVVYSFDVS